MAKQLTERQIDEIRDWPDSAIRNMFWFIYGYCNGDAPFQRALAMAFEDEKANQSGRKARGE